MWFCAFAFAHQGPTLDFSQHASHVTMSVIKLLSRIKAPTNLDMMEGDEDDEEKQHDIHAHLHDHTYGITSDPLTQFACAFAALVHDVDHEGKDGTCGCMFVFKLIET